MSFKFGSTVYRSSTQMHDDIAFTFIGAGAEPDLKTADYTLENFDHEVGEMETQWEMTSGNDAVRCYDREELRAAIQRLRDGLAAEQDDENEAA